MNKIFMQKLISLTTIVICLLFTFFNSPAIAGDESNARSVGMAHAFSSIARGYHALKYNPANLGISEDHSLDISVLEFGFMVENSSFGFNDYSRYNDDIISEDDKQKILSQIPDKGLEINAIAEGSGLGFSLKNFAFLFSGEIASNITIPKDPFEMVLYGNYYKPNISDFSSRGEAWGIADFAVGYGSEIRKWKENPIYAGITFHYIRGFAYYEVMEAEGFLETQDTAIVAQGKASIRSSTGGSGFSADLGIALELNDKYLFGLTLTNLINNVSWTDDTEITDYYFNLKPLNANIAEDESLFVSDDSSYTIGYFSKRRPTTLKLGVSSKYKKALWAAEYEQGFENRPGSSATPRLAAGLEFHSLNWLRLRTGFSMGGVSGFYYSLGCGLGSGAFRFDLGLAFEGFAFPTNSRGIRFSLSTYLNID
ncbi:MAG: hypothetical protein GF315_09950 [candidate division Zixibacteria bacterium]|nr:hypothetical protein [candidate division Zixibacteria bacterium]